MSLSVVLNEESGKGFRIISKKMRFAGLPGNRLRPRRLWGTETDMPKPPTSTPHSDLDGVRRDQRPVPESANEAGQDSADLERAGKESAGRPPVSGDEGNADDRSA